MGSRKKQDIVTFKVDESLAKAMEGIANRSEFIRGAILAALDNVCPLCQGTGNLSPEQKSHWKTFARNHEVRKCADCDAIHIVCEGQ